MSELIDVPSNLSGVAVADTEVGDVLGDLGYYHYRGRSAPELAQSSSFENVAALVLDGTGEPLAGDRRLPPTLAARLAGVDLRSAISLLGAELGLRPLIEIDPLERRADAVRLISVMPTLVASVRHGEAVEPDPSLGHVADFLRMITGTDPTPEAVRALEVYFVLTIDHGLNNATFATRVVASSGADLAACALAGFAALNGPRHGANTERILDMLDAVGATGGTEEWMKGEIAARRRLQGFGHAVYRSADPRLVALREQSAIVSPARHAAVVEAEEVGTRLLAGRRLVPNLDLYSAVVLEGCGIPRGWFTATFATARLVGWCAHALEQVGEPRIMRPAARYVGPPPDADIY